MARLSPLKAGLALFVICLTLEHVASNEKCRSGCNGVTPKNFRYADGSTYKYNLESNLDITLSSAEGQQSSTKLKATVLLTQQPQCNQIIKLQNVQVIGSDGKKHGTVPDLEKPIRINFHDGHVEDHICAEPGDTQNSLNIKRAVASLFQAALESNHETDIFGVCPTEIRTHKEGNVLYVTKTRSLNRCSHREHVKHNFLSTAFNLHSEIKSSPILKSDYVSEMRVKDGILEHVLLTENYLYMPFSVGKNGAKAAVQTKLQFIGKGKESGKPKCTESKSLIFENPHPLVSQKSDVTAILQAVKDTANTIGTSVGEHTAGKFASLIKILGGSRKDDLLAVYNQIKSGAGFSDKTVAKKVFLDALFRAGTGECVEVAIELLKNKELSLLEQKMVYLGMAFVRHATPNSLLSAASLLDQPNLPREAYLGVGSLAARYCGSHDCHNLDQLNKLSHKLVSKLKDGKPANRESENEMISILKALTNMKQISDAAVPKIIAIGQDKKNPARVRVAALEAYKADACKDKFRDSAINILKDIQQDSEIRIKAYLALAECPNGKVANALKSILDNEPSIQVGGFIVSHIRNLRASANPDKALAKHELANVNTMKRFPIDPRKYSYSTELSYAFNTLGVSSSIENNIIYSQNSFMPRSVGFNLTTEIFGHKINFLEIDTRQENFDRILERFFGPQGEIMEKDADELFASGKKDSETLGEQFKQRLAKTRAKRQTPKSEIDSMGKQVHIKTHELNQDMDLDLSIKLFGSEMLFLSLTEEAANFVPSDLIDKIFDSLDAELEKAKNFDHTFRSNMLFADMELGYPTSMGFPLRLGVEGTSAVQVKAAGNIDVNAIMRDADTLLKLTLIPSANIELACKLTVDAGIVENGLKTISNLYTSTGGAVVTEFFNSGKGFDMRFTLPIEKQQLLSAKHEIVFVSRDAGCADVHTPLKFIENKDFSVCLDQLSPIIGLTACAELNTPNVQLNKGLTLPYPFNGNTKASVWIERDEPISYHVKNVIYTAESKTGFEFVTEMLGENNQPKVSFQVEGFILPEVYLKATLDSPIKKVVLEGRITDNNQEKSISTKLVHDNQEYSGKLGVSVQGSPAKSVYTPLIEYRTPQAQGAQKSPITVEGTITYEVTGSDLKYTFNDIKLIAPQQHPIIITGNVGKRSGDYFCDVQLNNGAHTGSLKGDFKIDRNILALNAEMKNTLSPLSNFNLKYSLKKESHALTSDLVIIHGEDLKSKTNVLTLYNYLESIEQQLKIELLKTKNKFSYPLLGAAAKLDFETTEKTLGYDVELEYNKIKIGSEMELKINQKLEGDYDFELEIDAMDNKLKVTAKRDIVGDKSIIDNCLEINGEKHEISGSITHKIKENDVDVGAQLTLKFKRLPEIVNIDQGLTYNLKDLKTHLKISTPSIVYIDSNLKASKTAGANGHLKLNLKDLVIANGDIKADKWVGKASLVVEFVKLKNKMKVDSTFTLVAPNYNVALNYYPHFEKDDKKITINTNNVVKEESVESKNNIDVFGEKLEVNVKGMKSGSVQDGKMLGEVEITLPNEMYLVGKLNRQMHTVNGVSNGHAYVNIEQRKNKNTPGSKASVKAEVKNYIAKDKTFDATYNIALDDSNGKNLNSDLHIVKSVNGGYYNVDTKSKTYGSLLPEPVEVHMQTKVEEKSEVGSITFNAKAGNKLSAKVDCKIDVSEEKGKPLTGELSFDVQTSYPKLKKLSGLISGSLLDEDKLSEFGGKLHLDTEDDGSNPEGNIHLATESSFSFGEHNGKINSNLEFQKSHPMNLALTYGHKEEGTVKKCFADASVTYAENKNIKCDITLTQPSSNEYQLDLKLNTPFDHAKTTTINQHFKKSEDGKTFNSETTLTMDDKKYVVINELLVSETAPKFKWEVTNPNGKTDKIVASANKGQTHYNSDLVIVYNEKDFTFDGSLDAQVESIEDFTITVKLDSPKLKLDKYVLLAKNKHNKASKVIEIEATSNNHNIIKGSTTYKTREEGGKYIAEGSGEFTVRDQKKTGNFKLIKRQLNVEKDGEQGVEINFDAGLGNKAVDAELKLTNKQFRVVNSYCEEKKQCAHFEIDSKTSVMDINEYHHELEVNVDLRKLGLLHEFGLKSVTTRKQLLLDHTVDIHFQSQENNKYQYSLYLHPKEAGVSLSTPKRTVAAEAKVTIPKGKGPIKGEVAMYLNKKADPRKTAILFFLDNVGDLKQGESKGEIKFTTPGLAKDLSLSFTNKYNTATMFIDFKGIIDVFSKPNSKLIFTEKHQFTKTEAGVYEFESILGMKSVGMGIDITYEELLFKYDTNAHSFKYFAKLAYNVDGKNKVSDCILELSPQIAHAGLNLMGREIFDVNSKLQLSHEALVADTNARAIGLRPTTSHFELKNFNMMKFTLAAQDNPGKKLVVSAGFIPGQIIDCRAEVGTSELFKVSMKLDEANFMKPEYGLSVENIKSLILDPCQQGINDVIKEGKAMAGEITNDVSETSKHLAEVAKRNVPDIKNVKDYYSAELHKLKEELGSDKTIQQLGDIFKSTFGAIIHAISEIVTKANELIQNITVVIQSNVSKIIDIFNAEILPQLKQLFETCFNIISSTFQNVSNMFFTLVGKLATILEKHQEPLKELATQFSALTQDLARFFYKNIESVKAMVNDAVKKMYEELKALPIFEEAKHAFENAMKSIRGYSGPLTNMIRDTLATLKDVMPNEESKILLTSISEYFEKKIQGEKVDDAAMLEKILENLLTVFKQALKQLNIKDINVINPNIYATNYFYAVPQLVAIKFSPLNHLFAGEVGTETLKETLYGLNFNPLEWIPPYRLYAVIVQGQHIFTFDGKHLTFPGKCNYLLARDAVNGNFTIAGTYTNGIMTALTVADKTDMITIKKGGQCMYNKESTDFPIHRSDLKATRFYDYIKISSDSGVRVYCDPQLLACLVSVSGFYHGQLRGLLGNGNHEPYDDFTMPNGKIVTSESDFGNSYKMGSACPAIKTVDHTSHHHAPSCTKLFSSDSSLFDCFPFVNTANFRMACDHGVAAGVKDTEEAVAMGYIAACDSKYISVYMPKEYAKCKNSEQPREIGEKFSVKHPSKAADIIVVVDQVKANEHAYKDLVQPLVGELTKEMASKGINDIEIHLMGYGGEHEDPIHYTHGGKLSFKGKLPVLKFTEEVNKIPLDVGDHKVNKHVKDIYQFFTDILLVTGQDIQSRTYTEAIDYPFRAHASRTLIALTGSSCPQGSLLVLQKLRSLVLVDNSVNINIITPMRDFKVKDAKITKSVIGFNGENVFTFSDAKKKPEGGTELHKDLEYNDYCVDFTIKNNGNVFVVDNFASAKANMKKQFISVVSHNIVNQVVSHEKGLDCECVLVDEMSPRNKCTVVHSAAKSSKKAHKKK